MKNRDGHTDDTKFFIGTEVEHSPAYGQRTLFVVGLQNPKEILARALKHDCPHIYLGANQTFKVDTDQESEDWFYMLETLVRDTGIWVTLDFDAKYLEWLLDTGMTEYDTFIPMISVKLPYMNQLGYNATLKLDDKGFKESNPGVWTHRIHDLMDRKVFTDWTKYTKDEVID